VKLTDQEIEKLNEQKRRDEEAALGAEKVQRKREERSKWKERDGYFQGAKVRRK
jgi:hypothetical protein